MKFKYASSVKIKIKTHKIGRKYLPISDFTHYIRINFKFNVISRGYSETKLLMIFISYSLLIKNINYSVLNILVINVILDSFLTKTYIRSLKSPRIEISLLI